MESCANMPTIMPSCGHHSIEPCSSAIYIVLSLYIWMAAVSEETPFCSSDETLYFICGCLSSQAWVHPFAAVSHGMVSTCFQQLELFQSCHPAMQPSPFLSLSLYFPCTSVVESGSLSGPFAVPGSSNQPSLFRRNIARKLWSTLTGRLGLFFRKPQPAGRGLSWLCCHSTMRTPPPLPYI